MSDRKLFASMIVPLPGTFADDARVILAVGGEIEKLKAALTKHGIAAEFEEKTVTVRPKKAEKAVAEAPTRETVTVAEGAGTGATLEIVDIRPAEREATDAPPAAGNVPPWAR